MSELTQEISRRKTFAIISHPDAGKTTLTEKFLLFGGAIQTAGAVKSNKITKTTASDFMEIERQRGISVATSVMAFEYRDCLIVPDNLSSDPLRCRYTFKRHGAVPQNEEDSTQFHRFGLPQIPIGNDATQ